MKLLVTGVTGFVGKRFSQYVSEQSDSCETRGVTRSQNSSHNQFQVASIDSHTNWTGAFEGIDCVVHCAARVHQINETEDEAKSAYHEVNTLGTLRLAQQAAENGVKRFVFISTIKVNGESTEKNSPFLPMIGTEPTDPYGASKYRAEVGLQKVAQETGIEVVIIRPPLVYGPGVKANFLSVMKWLKRGVPLPLGAIHNQRSLVYLDNLVDLIFECCSNPNAAGETFLVSDDFDVSTSQFLSVVSKAMGIKTWLMPIPMSWLIAASKIIGKPQIAQRLCGNLQVDISHTKKTLDWSPKVTFSDGIQRTVDSFLNNDN